MSIESSDADGQMKPSASRPTERDAWERIETIHAVTYFAPESIDAAAGAGLRGFWMGYFGFRAAPLGAVNPGVVAATFANFEPGMVARALPDAWTFADPDELVSVRAHAAAAALRRIDPSIDDHAHQIAGELRSAVAGVSPLGRPLFGANQNVAAFDDPVAALWQACTVFREHRGDGHVAALAAHGIDGVEAHHLLAADAGIDPAVFFASRGWSEHDQLAGLARLQERGLLDSSGQLTTDGRSLRTRVEQLTDTMALTVPGELLARLGRIAQRIAGAEVLRYPNPMGLPKVEPQD